jgi:group II intron maturase
VQQKSKQTLEPHASKNPTLNCRRSRPCVNVRLETTHEPDEPEKLAKVLHPGGNAPWKEVKDQANRILKGWSNYFNYGTVRRAYRSIDQYVAVRARHLLRRRHKVKSRGTTRFPDQMIFGELGVHQLRSVVLPRIVSLT